MWPLTYFTKLPEKIDNNSLHFDSLFSEDMTSVSQVTNTDDTPSDDDILCFLAVTKRGTVKRLKQTSISLTSHGMYAEQSVRRSKRKQYKPSDKLYILKE